MQAEMEMIMRSGLLFSNTATTIGIRIPKVPQDVPVANARKQPTTKMIAGRKFKKERALDANHSRHIDICAEAVRHRLLMSRQNEQDHDRRDHGLKAFRDTCHALGEFQDQAHLIESRW